MAATYICDGCHAPVAEPVKVGHVVQRDYCQACAETAEAFVSAEDKERAAVHSVFQGKREKLIKRFGVNGFLLPDVIHAE